MPVSERQRAYDKRMRPVKYAKNRAHALAYQKQYDAKNRAKKRAWKKAHPEARRKEAAIRRARLLGSIIGDPKVIEKWEKSWRSKRAVKCYWCKRSTSPKGCHADHIDPLSKKGAHSIGNMCISCGPCNLRKQALNIADWNSHLLEPVLL